MRTRVKVPCEATIRDHYPHSPILALVLISVPRLPWHIAWNIPLSAGSLLNYRLRLQGCFPRFPSLKLLIFPLQAARSNRVTYHIQVRDDQLPLVAPCAQLLVSRLDKFRGGGTCSLRHRPTLDFCECTLRRTDFSLL